MRAAANSVIVSRCVRAASTPAACTTRTSRRCAPRCSGWPAGRALPGGWVQRPAVRLRAAGRRRRRLPQRGHRRRVGARQGHPRPLHATRVRAPPRVGLRDERRLLHPGAPRRDRRSTASRRCTGCRSSRSRTSSWRSAASSKRSTRRQNASSRCSRESSRPWRSPRCRSRRSGARAGAAAPGHSWPASHSRAIARSRRRLRGPIASRGPAGPPRAGHARLDLAEDEEALVRRDRGRALRSGCGSCARRSRSPRARGALPRDALRGRRGRDVDRSRGTCGDPRKRPVTAQHAGVNCLPRVCNEAVTRTWATTNVTHSLRLVRATLTPLPVPFRGPT